MPVKSIIQVPGVRVSAKAVIPALPVRITGAQGATGVPGPPGTGMPGEDGDDSWIPGPAGAQGPQGPAGSGAQGPSGRDSLWFPEDGDDSWVPGPQGIQGLQGPQGPAGAGGGSATVGPPGIDGDDGEAWVMPYQTPAVDPWVPVTMTRPPAAASWTQFAAVSQTFEDFATSIQGVRLRAPGKNANAQGIAGAYMAIPGGTTWDVIVRVRNTGVLNRSPFTTWGILLYDSGSGKLLIWGPGYQEGMAGRLEMTNTTTFSATSNDFSGANTPPATQEDRWLRVHVDATNYTFYISLDGNYWVQGRQETKTTFLTTAANNVGIGFNTNNNGGGGTHEMVMECGSWFAG